MSEWLACQNVARRIAERIYREWVVPELREIAKQHCTHCRDGMELRRVEMYNGNIVWKHQGPRGGRAALCQASNLQRTIHAITNTAGPLSMRDSVMLRIIEAELGRGGAGR